MQAKLYGRFAYMICDLVYTAPVATLSFATFAYPACTLAGPKANIHVFLWLLIGRPKQKKKHLFVFCLQ